MTREMMGDTGWFEVLQEEFQQPYFLKLKEELRKEYTTYHCCPKATDIFNAFKVTSPNSIRVLILVQDPYPFGNHSHGIALSSLQKETPASLRYVFREVDRDVVRTNNYEEFKEAFPNNDLTPWCKQGVMLLNSVLTVRAEQVGSHQHLGWQQFTRKVVEYIVKDSNPKAICLWGADAAKLFTGIQTKHLVLKAGHPAAAAHGKDTFSGCNHFSRINHYFMKNNQPLINWRLNG